MKILVKGTKLKIYIDAPEEIKLFAQCLLEYKTEEVYYPNLQEEEEGEDKNPVL